jgi:hypothetical protein
MIIKKREAGDKKNHAGEQVHGSYSMSKGVGLRVGSWVAGVARTSWRFLLSREAGDKKNHAGGSWVAGVARTSWRFLL